MIIEKGMTSEDIRALAESGGFKTNPLSSLKWGMVFTSVGIAALLGVWSESVFHNDGAFIPGLIALFGGIALVLFYTIADRKSRSAAK
jgi:hypothetical protein